MKHFFAVLLGVLGIMGRLPAQDTGAKPPDAFLQILNGIAPGPIDVEIDGKVLFPSVAPGQRISAFGLPGNKVKLVLVDKNTGQRKTIPLELEKGHYTLVTAGDFQLQEGMEKTAEGESPVRIFASVLNNRRTTEEPPVRVRLVNGLIDKPVAVKMPGGKSWTVDPMKMEVASGLPEKLLLEASGPNNSKRNLYLSQQAPAKNIAVVFYPSGDGFAFRAMTEFTPEGAEADQRQAEEAEKREAEEASRNQP